MIVSKTDRYISFFVKKYLSIVGTHKLTLYVSCRTAHGKATYAWRGQLKYRDLRWELDVNDFIEVLPLFGFQITETGEFSCAVEYHGHYLGRIYFK